MTTNALIDKSLKTLVSTISSQDPIDAAADELRIATRIKRYAEQRHKTAVFNATHVIGEDKIEALKEQTTNNRFKTEKAFSGAELSILISCNAPAMRLDATQLVNELIKAGVKRDIVDKCVAAAGKQSAPATSFSVVEQS